MSLRNASYAYPYLFREVRKDSDTVDLFAPGSHVSGIALVDETKVFDEHVESMAQITSLRRRSCTCAWSTPPVCNVITPELLCAAVSPSELLLVSIPNKAQFLHTSVI
jgi:hypothetical protein